MKNTIKKVTAILSAAAFAALPAAGSLTADAAGTAYNTDRTYVIQTQIRTYPEHYTMPVLDIRFNRTFSSSYTQINAGTINGTISGKYSGLELLPYPAPAGMTSTYFNGAKITPTSTGYGTLMSFTCTNSLSQTPEELGYSVNVTTVNNSSAASAITYNRTVRIGDVSAYITSLPAPQYNGLTSKDALFVQNLINYFGRGSFATLTYSYDKVISLSNDIFRRYSWATLNSDSFININGSYVSWRMAFNAILASDINNDGLVTPTDASAIMKKIANPGKYPNFSCFNGKSDRTMKLELDK